MNYYLQRFSHPACVRKISLATVAVALMCSNLSVAATPPATPKFTVKKINVIRTASRVQIQVSGTVTDETGQGLPGASVSEKGTTNGVTTTTNGDYTITVAGEKSVLVFSYIGYAVQEITVGAQTRIAAKLLLDISSLTEVVVVGYGEQKKASVTGAVAQVSAKEITALPVPSVEAALQGRVAGIQVTSNGVPGEAPIVRVRGVGSINFAANPLYVVDGLPVGDMNSIDTRDIESLDVLKDAASAAIYGSRAANGVILITTKKGKADGKLHVNLDSYYGVQTAWRKLSLMNSSQYQQYGKELLTNANSALPNRWNELNSPVHAGTTQTFGQTDTDWQNEMFRTGKITQHSLSLSGGTEKSRLYASVGYFKQDGILLGTDYERMNVRFNGEHTLSKVFTFGHTLFVAGDKRQGEANSGGRTQIKHMVQNVPYLPVYNPNEYGGFYGASNADASDPENPVRIATQDINTPATVRFMGTANVDAKITSWLKYRLVTGLDYLSSHTRLENPRYSAGQYSRNNYQLTETRGDVVNRMLSNQLTFDKAFGQHNVNLVMVAEQQYIDINNTTAFGSYPDNNIRVLSAGSIGQSSSGRKEESVLLSYIARLNYDFRGKYLFSASIRRDGSSAFAPGKQWDNFPAVSVGWRISEEAFMQNVAVINNLKLRASYGKVGFNGIGNYRWQPLINSVSQYQLGGSMLTGLTTNMLGNTELAWETTNMTNIGLDVALLSNKITFSADYYVRKTADNSLILTVPLPTSMGITQEPIANIGAMENKGLDLQLGYQNQIKDLKWDIVGNFGFVTNQVLALNGATSSIDRGSAPDYGGMNITRTTVGQPVQYFYGWEVAGIFQSKEEVLAAPKQQLPSDLANYNPAIHTAAGDLRFKDQNNDGVIDDKDRVKIGNFMPKLTYGVNINASYKNFDLTLYLQGVQGNDIYNGTKVLTEGMQRLFNGSTNVLNSWKPTNTDTDIPRAVSGDPNRNARVSDRFIEKGSYMRVKNMTIGYRLPTSLLSSLTNGTISNVRIYVSGQNLLTFTKYTGYDPEIGSRFNTALQSGIDYGQYPQPRVVMGGLQIGF